MVTMATNKKNNNSQIRKYWQQTKKINKLQVVNMATASKLTTAKRQSFTTFTGVQKLLALNYFIQ